MAQSLKNGGVPADAVFRVGWEMNIPTWPWNITMLDPASGQNQWYIDSMRFLADTLRKEFSASCKIDWNPLKDGKQTGYFLKKMGEFIATNAANIAYECYFQQSDMVNNGHDLYNNNEAGRIEYLARWRRA